MRTWKLPSQLDQDLHSVLRWIVLSCNFLIKVYVTESIVAKKVVCSKVVDKGLVRSTIHSDLQLLIQIVED